MPYIISTMSQGRDYVFYESREDKGCVVSKEVARISIKGGQGGADRKTLITPEGGVITEVSDAQLELLKTHPLFNKHLADGFVYIGGSENNAKAAVKDMEQNDAGAQMTAADMEDLEEASQADEVKTGGEAPKRSTAKKTRKRK